MKIQVTHTNSGLVSSHAYYIKNGACDHTVGMFADCDAMEARDWKEVFDAGADFAKKHGATF